jgi:hypothetical protein
MHWTQDRRTEKEKREDFIKRLAKAGARLSRHCRNAWTGERTRTYLGVDEFTGRMKDLVIISGLCRGGPLLDYANVADLHGFYLGAEDQHTWSEDKWEEEIRKRMPEK